MDTRPTLQDIFEQIMKNRNVYNKSPKRNNMEYPCIKYELNGIKMFHANNIKYNRKKSYTVTLMDYDPNSEFFDKILALPYCSFNRAYTVDNINHFVFIIYF